MLILGFLAYAVYTLHEVFEKPKLRDSTEVEYFSYNQNTDAYNITTLNSTIAISISSGTYVPMSRYMRVVFQ